MGCAVAYGTTPENLRHVCTQEGARTEGLARQFGVCKTQIRNIINGKHWREK